MNSVIFYHRSFFNTNFLFLMCLILPGELLIKTFYIMLSRIKLKEKSALGSFSHKRWRSALWLDKTRSGSNLRPACRPFRASLQRKAAWAGLELASIASTEILLRQERALTCLILVYGDPTYAYSRRLTRSLGIFRDIIDGLVGLFYVLLLDQTGSCPFM